MKTKLQRNLYGKISSIFGLILFLFLIWILYSEWGELTKTDFSFNFSNLLLAFVLTLINILILGLTWSWLIKTCKKEGDVELKNRDKIIIFTVSWIARYIPGKIFSYAGKIFLASKKGVSKTTMSIVSTLELGLSTIAHVALSIVAFIFFIEYESSTALTLLIILLLLGFIFVHPKTLLPILNFAAGLFKKEKVGKKSLPPYPKLLLCIASYMLAILTRSVAFYFIVSSLLVLQDGLAVVLVFSFIVSGIVGKMAVISPGGLGFQEGAIVILLLSYFSLPQATLISVFSRICFVFVDLVLYIIVYFLKIIYNKRNVQYK